MSNNTKNSEENCNYYCLVKFSTLSTGFKRKVNSCFFHPANIQVSCGIQQKVMD